eukprot:Plantae.Rhodophyta-Palmaria_palmata.ctg25526.p1 GENE.Plantae.Rhodophyta-Palmaria_palmata.ctg25526~~Plantae.Rhodophyta-Palmaria_palmata.ctg25526.p1  ORF type:complete len:262 (+),score=28.35 Plantae.Rhodophyta-Palmaria_palmata.ctg25526:69-788(+)
MVKFLQIQLDGSDHKQTTKLEVTGNHLLFVPGNNENSSIGGMKRAVQASQLTVGDHLLLLDGTQAKISKISPVQRRGFYAPYTSSGTIIVANGVVASTFAAVHETGNYVEMGRYQMSMMSLQTWYHMLETPHRLLCKVHWSACQEETYNQHDDSMSNIFALFFPAYQWWTRQPTAVAIAVAAPVAVLLSLLYLVEQLVLNTEGCCFVLFACTFLLSTAVVLIANKRFVTTTTTKKLKHL